jgi:hypothetical protein
VTEACQLHSHEVEAKLGGCAAQHALHSPFLALLTWTCISIHLPCQIQAERQEGRWILLSQHLRGRSVPTRGRDARRQGSSSRTRRSRRSHRVTSLIAYLALLYAAPLLREGTQCSTLSKKAGLTRSRHAVRQCQNAVALRHHEVPACRLHMPVGLTADETSFGFSLHS